MLFEISFGVVIFSAREVIIRTISPINKWIIPKAARIMDKKSPLTSIIGLYDSILTNPLIMEIK